MSFTFERCASNVVVAKVKPRWRLVAASLVIGLDPLTDRSQLPRRRTKPNRKTSDTMICIWPVIIATVQRYPHEIDAKND